MPLPKESRRLLIGLGLLLVDLGLKAETVQAPILEALRYLVQLLPDEVTPPDLGSRLAGTLQRQLISRDDANFETFLAELDELPAATKPPSEDPHQ